jgi:very-short-patch-repair endonuclease
MSLKYRRHLRKNLTNPERIIWQKLRDRQIGGIKFRRQHNIGKYIVDFYSLELNLIIEIDGDVHAYQKENDKAREIFLENRGLKIIRYTNYEIRTNLIGVLEDILRKCEELKKGNR